MFTVFCFLMIITTGVCANVCSLPCTCWIFIGLIDCSHHDLSTTPNFNSIPNAHEYYSLSLRNNNFSYVNFSAIVKDLPSIKMVDISENNFLRCTLLDSLPLRIELISDCSFSGSTTTTPQVSSSTKTSTSRHPPSTLKLTTSLSMSSTAISKSSTSKVKSTSTSSSTKTFTVKTSIDSSSPSSVSYPPYYIVYIYTIIPTVFFIIFIIMLTIYVRRWCLKKSHINESLRLEMSQLHPYENEEEEEEIIVYSK